MTSGPATIDACVTKSGAKKGQLRIVSAATTCKKSERKITWAAGGVPGQTGAQGAPGPQGPQGDVGAKGDKGDAGTSGSADTPAQILAKLSTVDGQGSGLDASLLDGLNSSQFAQLSASSSAAIAIPSIAAHSCIDYNNVALGGVDPGDVVIVREGDGAVNIPAGVLMMAGSVQSGKPVIA